MKNIFSLSRITCFVLLQLILVVSSQAYILTKSAPIFCYDSFLRHNVLIFEGMDDGLYKIKTNDLELYEQTWNPGVDLTQTKATRLGVTLSQPSVKACAYGYNYIYYQGPDNELCRIRIDGKNFQDLHYQTKSTPCVDETCSDAHIYFQCYDRNATLPGSLDNDLCKINEDGTGFVDLGCKTASTPCFFWETNWKNFSFNEPTLFFQAIQSPLLPNIQNHLCKIRTDGTGFVDLKRQTASRPWVAPTSLLSYSRVYFQSTSNDLCSVHTNGTSFLSHQILTFAAPFGIPGGIQCYFYGTDKSSIHGLFCLSWIDGSWRVPLPLRLNSESMKSAPTQNAFSRDNSSTPAYLYIQDSDNRLKALFIAGHAE